MSNDTAWLSILQRISVGLLSVLAFSGVSFAQSASPANPESIALVQGYWLGTLHAPAATLRIQLTVTPDGNQVACSVDSLDQDAFDLQCANIVYSGKAFSFDIPVVHGHWSGRLSEDGRQLAGTWNQGGELPLDFERQEKRQGALPPDPISYDPAIAPVGAADMQSVLAHDLTQALQTGDLAPQTEAGVAIGVVRNGVRRVFAFGTAKPNSIFEIGSVTKTFTGLILAQMVQQGSVSLDAPLRELLPAGTVTKPVSNEITLIDLVTQHSGLPRMPDNFNPADPADPYADYGVGRLYAYIAQHGVERPEAPDYLYSNLGFALLGQALASRSGATYAQMLKQQVTDPLGMHDTAISLSADQTRRLIPGHLPNHQPAHGWDLNAFAGVGAIRATAGDMLTYLEAQLHPERISLHGSPHARTLAAAIIQSHQLRADAGPQNRIAFAWTHGTGFAYWHNGATGGYSSFVFFNPEEDFAAVVLLNTAISKRRTFEKMLAEHINERFWGKPAISLGPSQLDLSHQ